jgi:hypothetical protein
MSNHYAIIKAVDFAGFYRRAGPGKPDTCQEIRQLGGRKQTQLQPTKQCASTAMKNSRFNVDERSVSLNFEPGL